MASKARRRPEALFRSVDRQLSVHAGSLPVRPSRRQLVDIAASPERRVSLRREIVEAGAPRVVTLGQEALDAVRLVADDLRGVQTRLSPDGYGRPGDVVVNGQRFKFLPLVHPGFRRQTSNARWRDVLAAWSEVAGSG